MLTLAQQEFLTTLTADHRQRVLRRWNSIREKIADIGEPSTLDELAHTVIGLVNKKLLPGTSVTGFSWDIRYTQHVPNTHSAPVFGVENWWQYKDIPCGYPGFTGRVWIRFSNYLSQSAHDLMSTTLTYPGTGGGGSYSGPWTLISSKHFQLYGYARNRKDIYPEPQLYSWDYRIYLDDWPELQKEIEKAQIVFALSGNTHEKFILKHKFLWNDPVTEAADREFLDSVTCKTVDAA